MDEQTNSELLTTEEKVNSALRHMRIAKDTIEPDDSQTLSDRIFMEALQLKIKGMIKATKFMFPEAD